MTLRCLHFENLLNWNNGVEPMLKHASYFLIPYIVFPKVPELLGTQWLAMFIP